MKKQGLKFITMMLTLSVSIDWVPCLKDKVSVRANRLLVSLVVVYTLIVLPDRKSVV